MSRKEPVSAYLARMRDRDRKRRAQEGPPSAPCAKCGADVWESCENEVAGCWYCFKCGARAYRVNGKLVGSGVSEAEGLRGN